MHRDNTPALILAANDESDVRSVLKDTADDFGISGKDNVYGYGLVDAEESVAVVQ